MAINPAGIAGDRAEAVAYALMCEIEHAERREPTSRMDRVWILSTYRDCLRAVQDKPPREKPA